MIVNKLEPTSLGIQDALAAYKDEIAGNFLQSLQIELRKLQDLRLSDEGLLTTLQSTWFIEPKDRFAATEAQMMQFTK